MGCQWELRLPVLISGKWPSVVDEHLYHFWRIICSITSLRVVFNSYLCSKLRDKVCGHRSGQRLRIEHGPVCGCPSRQVVGASTAAENCNVQSKGINEGKTRVVGESKQVKAALLVNRIPVEPPL